MRHQHIFEHETQKSATSDLFTEAFIERINDDIQIKNATYLPAQSPAHKINDKNTTLT